MQRYAEGMKHANILEDLLSLFLLINSLPEGFGMPSGGVREGFLKASDRDAA